MQDFEEESWLFNPFQIKAIQTDCKAIEPSPILQRHQYNKEQLQKHSNEAN